VALAIGFAYHESGRAEWQTMVFTSLALMQVFQAFGTRSHLESLRTIGATSNRVMVAIAALVVGLQLAAVSTPLRGFLDLEPLGPVDLGVCVAAGVGLLVVLETVKARHRARA
jgi:Ca2+-transporting ATPase